MKHKITITEPCPRCHSDRTGKILYYTGKHQKKLKMDALERGELIQLDPFGMGDTCFCMDCGATWYGHSHTEWITNEELEKRKNYIQSPYSPLQNQQKNQQIKFSETMKSSKKKQQKKKGGIFKVFFVLSHCFLAYLKLFVYDATIGVFKDAAPKRDKKKREKDSGD